ncbi:MAG: hypothetical protein IPJ86_06310 [Bacteroidetes bacterium]|nr:hypothetical protein [Bacteroidota bacterium]
MLNNLPAFDALMAVRRGNGRDWWLIFQRWFAPNATTPTNAYFYYLIDPSGISGPFNQNTGIDHKTNLGHLVFNTDGEQICNGFNSWLNSTLRFRQMQRSDYFFYCNST